MKLVSAIIVVSILCLLQACISKPQSNFNTKLKARFEVAGICSNYTFSLLGGNIEAGSVVESWTNPQTNTTYTKAFSIANPCDLPKNLKEGDEFYFKIENNPSKHCMACMAYYPTPDKKLNIKVLQVTKK